MLHTVTRHNTTSSHTSHKHKALQALPPALCALRIHARHVGVDVQEHLEAHTRDNLHGLLHTASHVTIAAQQTLGHMSQLQHNRR